MFLQHSYIYGIFFLTIHHIFAHGCRMRDKLKMNPNINIYYDANKNECSIGDMNWDKTTYLYQDIENWILRMR